MPKRNPIRDEAQRLVAEEIGLPFERLDVIPEARLIELALNVALLRCRRHLSIARCRLLHARNKGLH